MLALDRDELVMHYQPKISLTTGEITGVEALVRWQHPERGLIDPLQFISVAEDCGLMLPIGN
jgi:EAL domain-containing protein (putative c-di-GMP-specific phosphodiesterase class I)